MLARRVSLKKPVSGQSLPPQCSPGKSLSSPLVLGTCVLWRMACSSPDHVPGQAHGGMDSMTLRQVSCPTGRRPFPVILAGSWIGGCRGATDRWLNTDKEGSPCSGPRAEESATGLAMYAQPR